MFSNIFNDHKKVFFFSGAVLLVILGMGFLGYMTYANYKQKIESNNTDNENQSIELTQPGNSNSMEENLGEPEFYPSDEEQGSGILIEKPLEEKSILMVIAFRDFNDKEYFIPKQYFLSAGAENVFTASNQMGDAVGADGGKVPVNLLLKDIKVSDFDAVVFVGGPGTSKYLYNEDVYRIASNALSQGKILGAIAEAQVLFKNATGKIVFANNDRDSDIFAINIIDFLMQ